MRGKWRALWRSTKGVAALEFAMIAPILLILFLGSFDLVRCMVFVELARRATISAGNAVSNSVAAGATITPELLGTILKQVETRSSSYIWPDNSLSGIILSVVELDGTGTQYRLDTQAKYPTSMIPSSNYGCQAGTAFVAAGSSQSNSGVANDMFIVAELKYYYTPFVFSSRMMGGSLFKFVSDRSFYRARQPMNPTMGGTC